MDSKEFIYYRKKLKKTQKQMAQLLGTSLKAVHSYEQGWRSIPPSAERHMFFLVSRIAENSKRQKPCWAIKNCSPEQKAQCPAWEFKAGKLCWFINGTICEGAVQKNWKEKMKICRSCEVFLTYFNVKRGSFLPAQRVGFSSMTAHAYEQDEIMEMKKVLAGWSKICHGCNIGRKYTDSFIGKKVRNHWEKG